MTFDAFVNLCDALAFLFVTPEFIGEGRLNKTARHLRRAAVRLRLFGRRAHVPEVFDRATRIGPYFARYFLGLEPTLSFLKLLGVLITALSRLTNGRFRAWLFLFGCAIFFADRAGVIVHSFLPEHPEVHYDLSRVPVRLR